MKYQSIEIIEKLTQINGLSGNEESVASLVQSLLPSGVHTEIDGIGNLLCTIKGTDPNASTILLASHMDEVGFMVNDILSNGFLRLSMMGGWNTLTLPSSPVDVINTKGELVRGVIGQISPHFLKKDAPITVPHIDDIFVDIGASSSDSVKRDYHIEIGSLVAPVSPFFHNTQSDLLFSKAFDDRIGVASLIELAHKVVASPISSTIILAFSVQEEVGVRGAKVLSNYVKADIALIVEGAPADDVPGGPERPQTCVGKGAHVRIFDPTHIGNRELLSLVTDVASKNSITIQKTVRKGGGTDAMEIALSYKGVKTIVVGVPVRYAHSHNGICSLKDYHELVSLLYAVCGNRVK
ncbi:MAG: M42 family peptidase [Spirochaetia bacterium]|nr:M42 family peptidase [Spirochaetia bacterium]